uniref:30S ribosomal protein S12 n=1 Tax=Gongylonema pulchrum TaxID=637853 RepID=A0A183D2S3_9BILA
LTEVAPHYYRGKELDDPASRKMPKQKGKSAAELSSL